MGKKNSINRLSLPSTKIVENKNDKEYIIGYFNDELEGSYIWYHAPKPEEYNGHIHKDKWEAFGFESSKGFALIQNKVAKIFIPPPGPYITEKGVVPPCIVYQVYNWRKGFYENEEIILVD